VRISLFAKIFATVVLALVMLALLLGAMWPLLLDRPDPQDRFPRRIAEAFLPDANAPIGETRQAIRRIADALDATVILRDRDGSRIAMVGDPEIEPQRNRMFARQKRVWRVRLSDGRQLIARFETPLRASPWRFVISLLVGAIAVALAALPVVWLITKRLRNLRESVEAFGQGALSTRATVKGGDEVAVLARSFNQSAERIEQLIDAHRSLLANASHELRSPLTRLRLALDLQTGNPTKEREKEITRNLEEIDALIEEILLASRLDRPDITIQRETIDLGLILKDEAQRHGIDASVPALPMEGDGVLIRRLFRNLLDNAMRHGAPPILLGWSKEDGMISITVQDHGQGIRTEDQARIFEPFYRPKGRSESAGGWGLGLSLVRQIALKHGGYVTCENARGGGALFRVTLPERGTAQTSGRA
jgi:signal transduction histidine kinase